MSFTPKHHKQVADCIRNARAKHRDGQASDAFATLQSELAKLFTGESPDGFSPSEFEAGCMPSPEMIRKAA